MDYIYIGEIVNTHGLKGEVRIISDFKFKESVFKSGIKVYIGKGHHMETISSYRVHKNYDMVTFSGLRHIEDVLSFKGEDVYVKRDEIEYEGYLNEDLINMNVYCNDKLIGHITSILKTNAHEILVIENHKKHMVPNIEEFVLNVSIPDNRMDIKYIKGLIDED